jgi:flagellar protein FliS
MYTAHRMRQYQQQAVASATPEQLVAKLYDMGVAACHRADGPKVRAVLVELIGSLNFEAGGELAERLHALYEYCLNETIGGDLSVVCQILTELRDTWKEGVLMRKAA